VRIGELARLTGKSVAALRYYEQAGLLSSPLRTEAGYRDYAPGTVAQVRFIVHAQQLGFSLKEIKSVLALSHRGHSPCEGVAKAMRRKIARLEQSIAQWQERRAMLSETLRLWESDLLTDSPICSMLNVSKNQEGRRLEMAKTVEVFVAGCPLCDETVRTVQSVACPGCEVKVYDLREGCATDDCRNLAQRYGVKAVPTVVVDGQIAHCCRTNGVDEASLRAMGVGNP
jgi:DNA-binding transcriptional MerR regulator